MCTIANESKRKYMYFLIQKEAQKFIYQKKILFSYYDNLNITDSADIGSKGAATISNCSMSGFGGSPRAPPNSEFPNQGNEGSAHHGNVLKHFLIHA